MRKLVLVLAIASGCFTGSALARAEQVIVRAIDYSNDSISDGGKTVACVVTVVAEAPPGPRVLNFQFIAFRNALGWKITGGLMDWKSMNLVASRGADGGFTTGTFIHDQEFKKNTTPERQLVGLLQNGALSDDFLKAFFNSPYTVRVRWQDAGEDVTYYIAQRPDLKVLGQFNTCVGRL
jgi:hypothetical protein